MCCIIVSGFRSFTMSAIVSITVVLPSFRHQCRPYLYHRYLSRQFQFHLSVQIPLDRLSHRCR